MPCQNDTAQKVLTDAYNLLENMGKWDERFLALAVHIAAWSKDPSTQVGAVIVDDKRRIIGHGYNGFPRGVNDIPALYANRDIKQEMVVHAEINAVHNARGSVEGCTLYTNFFPCPRCAGQLIQAGIRRVVSTPHESDARYRERRAIAEQMFNEAGVLHA